MVPPRWALTGLLIFAALAPSACGKGANATTGCGPAVRELLDGNLGHVLPGAPEPTYLTDPPTSGPHTPGVKPTGVATPPLERPVQGGALEAGIGPVQYRDGGDP